MRCAVARVVQLIYERALVAFPVTSHLWLQYARFVETQVKMPDVINSVYKRAARNCPWVTLRALESPKLADYRKLQGSSNLSSCSQHRRMRCRFPPCVIFYL